MPQETILLPNKLHALLTRVCAEENTTPSKLLINAVRREIKAELPKARFIIKAAEALGIESPVARLIKKAAKKKGATK